MSAPTHPNTPWTWKPCETDGEIGGDEPISGAQLLHADGTSVFSVDCGDYQGLSDADAKLIVRAVNAQAAPAAGPQGNRDAHGKHRHEDAAMKIVEAVHRDFAPQMDDNDGGELLGWILQFANSVIAEVMSETRPPV